MSTETDSTAPKDRLSPSWIRRASVSWRRKSAQDGESAPSTSNSLLAPRRTNSEESRSGRSKSLDSRTSFRGVVHRLRSSSSASSLGARDDNDIHDWFQGFRRYNQLVTTQISPAQSFDSSDLVKATKPLTKNCGGHLIHGLPEAAFDFSLLWCPVDDLTRRDNNEPSWSYTAYQGPVTFPFDPTTCPDLSRASRSSGDLFRSEITNFHIGPPSAPYTIRRDKSTALRTKYPPYFHAPRGSDTKAHSNTLRFTASTIPADGFTSEQLHYHDAEIPVCHLINPHNKHCGVIMDRHASISSPSPHGPFEFILLSRNPRREAPSHTRRSSDPTVHPPGTPIWHGGSFVWDHVVVDFDDDVFEDGEWKVLNLMLIKWVGESAERVAIARMHEDAWNELKPVKKEIVLR